ncbi:MAG: PIG-L family deacetylase, partial [Anaerolineaceae bacterium]|nr:PIG-L family deacetylase [Anaerolineaceae bacterium]
MRWVYLSPHFDDVVLSSGGLVWEQVRAGQQVEIWTICAGAQAVDAPLSPFALQLHQRWQTEQEAVSTRQQEDQAAIGHLGAGLRYWDLPDCIYRQLPGGSWLVNGEEDLWKPVHPLELPLVEQLAAWLVDDLRPDDILVSPLTLGNHVDHFLVRAAAETLGRPLHYYPDYPYAVTSGTDLLDKTGEGWQKSCYQVSRAALSAWQLAVGS